MTLDLAHVISIAFNIILLVTLYVERHRAVIREQDLIEAVMAENLTDYHNSPKKQLKMMDKESKLAERAYNLQSLEKTEREPGLQVT